MVATNKSHADGFSDRNMNKIIVSNGNQPPIYVNSLAYNKYTLQHGL